MPLHVLHANKSLNNFLNLKLIHVFYMKYQCHFSDLKDCLFSPENGLPLFDQASSLYAVFNLLLYAKYVLTLVHVGHLTGLW